MDLIYEIIYKNFSKYFEDLVIDNGVKFKIFGSRINLPKKILDIFENIENLSFNNNTLNLNIAFNYGFKYEIKEVLNRVKDISLKINLNNQQEIDKLFDIGTFPDPDILIRTGNNKISKLLLDCKIEKSNKPEIIKIWGIDFNVSKYEEDCEQGEFNITNSYYLDDRGVVRQSHQYHSETIGNIFTQRLDQ